MRSWRRILGLVLGGALLASGSVAWAQGAAAPAAATAKAAPKKRSSTMTLEALVEAKKLALEQKLEERARNLISGLDVGQYLLVVKAEIDVRKIQSAYLKSSGSRTVKFKGLPGSATSSELLKEFVRELSSDDLFEYLKKIDLSITLDEGVGAEQSAAIESSLKSSLQLKDGRDSFKLQKTKMASATMKSKLDEAAKEAQAARDELKKLEDNMRDLEREKGKAEGLARDKQSLEEKKSNLEKELEDLRREKAKLESELTQEEKTRRAEKSQAEVSLLKAQVKEMQGYRAYLRGLEFLIGLIPVALVLLLLGRWFIKAQSQTARAQAEGLNALAGAVAKIAKTGGMGKGETIEAAKAQESSARELGEGGQNLEFLRKEAEMTWELLRKEPYAMFSVLKDWLTDAEGRLRFLAFSEAIGAENARALWAKFPRNDLEPLTPLLYEPISKANAYSSVAQLYRLVAKEVTLKPPFFAQLDLEFLIGLNDAELVEALESVSVDAAGAALLMVSPGRAGRLLKLVTKHDKAALMMAFGAASGLSQAEAKARIDEIRKAKPAKEQNKAFDISSHVLLLMDSGDADVRNAVTGLLQKDAELGAKIREQVFTFDDVMLLDEDSLFELFGDLDDGQVASLAVSCSQPQFKRIAGFYPQKRMLGIREELNRLEKKPALKRKAKTQGEQLQMEIARMVKAGVESGKYLIERPQQGKGAPQQGAPRQAPQGNAQAKPGTPQQAAKPQTPRKAS